MLDFAENLVQEIHSRSVRVFSSYFTISTISLYYARDAT